MGFKTLTDSVIGITNKVFGTDCLYTPNGGSQVTIQGVFDNAWVETEGVTSLKPTVRIALADLQAKPRKGDAMEIAGVNYRLLESREDGFGGSTLILQKV